MQASETPVLFGELIGRLRAHGMTLGVSEHERLVVLLSRWPETAPSALRDAVAAVLARDPAEFALVQREFDLLVPGEPTPVPVMLPIAETPVDVEELEAAAEPPPRPRQAGWMFLTSIALVSIVLTLAVWRLTLSTPTPPPVSPPDAGVAAAPAQPDETPTDVPPPPPLTPAPVQLRKARAVAVLSTIFLVCFALSYLQWLRAARRRYYLHGNSTALMALPGPATYKLVLRGRESPFTRETLDEVAAALDQLRSTVGRSVELDVPRTLQLVLDARVATPKFKPRLIYPSLIVLIDSIPSMKLWEQKIDALLLGLHERGVPIETFYLGSDASWVFQAEGRNPLLIEELLGPGDRPLLVISDGRRAVLPGGELAPWVRAVRQVRACSWLHPLANPALWSQVITRIPVRVWPMTRWGLLGAAGDLCHSARRRWIHPALLFKSPKVTAHDVQFLRRLLARFPLPTLELAELLRQRYLPALSDEILLRVLAASPGSGDGVLRFSAAERQRLLARPAMPTADAEVAYLRYLLSILSDSQPPPGSAAHLRWQLDRLLVEGHLPEELRSAGWAENLSTLVHQHLAEEVVVGLQTNQRGAPPVLAQLHRTIRRDVQAQRWVTPRLRDAVISALVTALFASGLWSARLISRQPQLLSPRLPISYCLNAEEDCINGLKEDPGFWPTATEAEKIKNAAGILYFSADSFSEKVASAAKPAATRVYLDGKVETTTNLSVNGKEVKWLSTLSAPVHWYRVEITSPDGDVWVSKDVWVPEPNLYKTIGIEAVRANRGDIQACIGEAYQRNGDAKGQMIIKLQIAPDGKVNQFAFTKDEVRDPAFAECMKERAVQWQLPAPKDGKMHIFSYTFNVSGVK